jgi:hypothetical protein
MRQLTWIGAVMFSCALVQAQPLTHQRALEDSVFQSCDDVFSTAVGLSAEIHESGYVVELHPRSRGSLAYPFPSETTAASAAQWIVSHDTKNIPYALFYFVKGAYTLRCRDNGGRYVKLSGPYGKASPLDLTFGVGKAEILYFYLTSNYRNAFVFAVTDVSLESLNGPDEIKLMEYVRGLLNARFVQSIYIRNDPWFLGTAPNSLIYLFTDSFKRITLREYLGTKTLNCNQNMGCKLYSVY